MLWESDTNESGEQFFTMLQGDGNLITRPGSPDDTELASSIWKSYTSGSGDFFLAFNCDGASISIYSGTPGSPDEAVWTKPDELPDIIHPIESIAGGSVPHSCEGPEALLFGGDMISVDNATSAGTRAFIVQEDDGKLCLMEGTPDNPGQLLWDSGVEESGQEFYSMLQKDGNLITRPGGPDDGFSSIWKSESVGEPADYFLGLNCDGLSMSIYEGTLENPGDKVWTSSGSIA